MKDWIKNLLILAAIAFFYFLPFIIKPDLLLVRDNDLQQQFWPFFYFIKQKLWETHTLPFWNNLILSGTPLLPDPQFSLFYPLNIIFLFFPTDLAFIVYFFLHTFMGGLGIYLVTRKFFNFSYIASLFSVSLYIASPRLAGYLEAGHSGLVASFGWLPWIIFATGMIVKKPRLIWPMVFGISLVGVFFTHTITFVLSLIASGIFFIALLFLKLSNNLKKSIFLLILGLLFTFGLTAITLLPQLDWASQTTRFLLIQDRQVYPQWFSVKEFFQNIFTPWIGGYSSLWNIDTEKWLSLGTISLFLAGFGFLKLSKNLKITFTFIAFFITLIALNNASPIYPFLISQDWYVLMRVSTRVWFIPLFIVTFLAGFGLEKLLKSKANKSYVILIAVLVIAELLLLSWARLFKPIPPQEKIVPQKIYEFLKQDRDKYRVFCLTRCIPQQEAAIFNLELVEGYNTLQQINYYKHMWQLSGGYWDYYTLALPPMGAKFLKLNPDAASLGLYNTKYIISPYILENINFTLVEKIGDFFVYQNNLFQSRAYFWTEQRTPGNQAPILIYTPNLIRVDTSKNQTKRLVLAEVYSPGWEAYLNGKEKIPVQETPNSLRLVDIRPDTKFVEFKYEPKSYQIGKIISLATIFILGILWIKRKT